MALQSSRGGRGRRWRTRVFVVTAFIVAMALAIAVVFLGLHLLRTTPQASTSTSGSGPSVEVDIKPGLTAAEIGMLLQEKGVIASAKEFVDLVEQRGTSSGLKPGIYKFKEGESLESVVEKLEKGLGTLALKVTIPEGMSIDQVAELLDSKYGIDGKRYEELCADPSQFVVPRVGSSQPDVKTLEGLLFPSTYYLLENEGPMELIGLQLEAFATKTAGLPWERCSALGISEYQAIIVASLIEKEARIPDERAKVAAVIYNRLKKQMPLGIDATVRYALKKWTGPLSEKDLKVDSPYNTRARKGLPPGPIASPGLAAIEAALKPAQVDYLYYVLIDAQGHHFFTASYEEFLKAKQQSQFTQ